MQTKKVGRQEKFPLDKQHNLCYNKDNEMRKETTTMTTDFFSPSFIEASLAVIHHSNSPFYASDINLNGGQINALACFGFIKPTGKTKAYYLDLDDDYARRVTVKEWKVNVRRMNDFFTNTLPAQIEQLQRLLNVTQKALNA